MLACTAIAGGAGCWNDVERPVHNASLSGDVRISGGLRGARVSADWLDRHTGEVRSHLGEAVTDEAGHFTIPIGAENGIFRIVAQGGTFEDLATGATIQLDDTDETVSLIRFGLLDDREPALVSPITHLVAARTMERLADLGDLAAAFEETRTILHGHFGEVDWGAVLPWPLDQRATSVTEPVRGAFVHAALSVLARDIAADAGASPLDVNVYQLMLRWTEDVRAGTFDGNDGNDRTPGSGLQLGYCPPPEPTCMVPSTGCTLGACRRLCDLYTGTARALLAGAIAKVIKDRGPGGMNQTGLDLADTISIVRGVADNRDDALFDASCVEALDRTPPVPRFEPPTPDEGAYVRGTIQLQATATDDLDPSPDVSLPGLADLDGDPHDAFALASADTTTRADGPWTVVARAIDLGGNVASAERVLAIDNTAPGVTLEPTGFFVDGSTWWTPAATPVLSGVVTDGSPVAIKAVIAGGDVPGVVTGSRWTIATPLAPNGTDVQVVATDAAGNTSSVVQRLHPDIDAPALSFETSTVFDEADDVVTFAADHSPHHHHFGMPIDLATPVGCPSITKFSYLLGAATPEYVTESHAPNPIRYQLVVDDPGVGVVPGSIQYRVGRRNGPQTVWVLDWTSAGAGTPAGTGRTELTIDLVSELVAGLATTEAIYEVEFRATDRLGRQSTVARCFDLALRASPVEVEPHSGTRQTKDHAYALDSLSLAPGAQFDQIAARLLNHDATGASLIDQDIFNGTTSTVYLTVAVTPPVSVTAAQSFVIDNALTQVMDGSNCNPTCPSSPMPGPTYASTIVPVTLTSLHFPVKVFELVGGAPLIELPCLAPCPPSGHVFQFAIPPRAAGGQPARAFRVMTMIGQVSALWPQDGTAPPAPPAAPPFADDEIVWKMTPSSMDTTTRLTGIVDRSVVPERTGCVQYHPSPMSMVCEFTGTIVPYRALRSAALTFSTETSTQYRTAPTASLTPVLVGTIRHRLADDKWSTSEGALP